MKFHRVVLMSLAAASLSACGGGSDIPYMEAQGLSLQAEPYINAMPNRQ